MGMKDLIGQLPIHYAIQFRHVKVFKTLLTALLEEKEKYKYNMQNSSGGMGRHSEIYDYRIVNTRTIPYTLASYCVIKQSWQCFVKLLELKSLSELQTTIDQPANYD